MKIIKKNVYYCDFCKKKSLRSLKEHEKHCTANPDRSCRLCDNKSVKEIIDKYRKYFYAREVPTKHIPAELKIQVVFKKKFTLEDIKNELDYTCPNCILTIIRCLGLNRYYFEKKYEFDYQKALNEWWALDNEKAQEEAERETYDRY